MTSPYFDKYFVKGNIEILGRVHRFAKNSSKEILNHTFGLFCMEKGLSLPTKYRKAKANIHAEYKSVAKYDKHQPELDEADWLLAKEWTKTRYAKFMSGSKVLPKEIVLVEMDKTTSSGYPWSIHFRNKTEMLADSKASEVLDRYWDLIGTENEDRIVPIWTLSQKIEMRDIEKLNRNSLRTFTASPFEFSTATNRMCLDANNKFYLAANKSPSCVGISKFQRGWHDVYTRLNKHPNAFELDESEYDSSLFRKALYAVRDIRWSYLQPSDQTHENWLRLCEIYDNIVNSVIVTSIGELIKKFTGNPSGSSNTVVDNTIILDILSCYAFIRLCREQGIGPSYDYYVENVEEAFYGDDDDYTCSDEVVPWYNPVNIARIWGGIGVVTNTPCEAPRKLADISFLSNGFHWDDKYNMYFPKPETERVLSSLMYGSELDDVRWHLMRACALRLDSYWNIEVRNILREYIDFLWTRFSDKFVGVVKISGVEISMKEIDGVWKSDDWIEALYSGYEQCDSKTGHWFKLLTSIL